MRNKYLLAVIGIIFLFFLPFLINPTYLAHQDNDLGRTYIPLFSFFKDSILHFHQIPLWRPEQLMGETFIGNPISALFYPGNLLFLVLPVNFSAVFYYFLHLVLAGIGTYFLAREKNINREASFAGAIFYALSIKVLMHITAGHITMVASFAYFPLLFLCTEKLIRKLKFKWLVTGAISLTFIYFNYPTIAYYSAIFIIVYWFLKTKNIPKLLAVLLLTFGLSAIMFFPQLELSSLSNRSILTIEDVAIPIWSKERFVESLIYPYKILKSLDHESLLYFGVVPTGLAFFGFLKLKSKQKIILLLFGGLVLLYAAGTSTPFFALLYENVPFLSFNRVTTRVWFLVSFVIALLAASYLSKIKSKKMIRLLIAIYIVETGFIFYSKTLSNPVLNFKNDEIYRFLSTDKDFFRVYCTTYCFNPQLISKYNLEVLHGETPIGQEDFINFLSYAGNYDWQKFSVIYPPYQVWQVSNPPMPNSLLLGQANVKYVASTYQIDNSNFTFINKFESVYIYQNLDFQSRVRLLENDDQVSITNYSPNAITIKFPPRNFSRELVISQSYYPGWIFLEKGQKFPVPKHDDVFQKVKIPPLAQEVTLKYAPTSYQLGKTITLATIVLLILIAIKRKNSK